MKVAIHQPHYFPWLGYFDKIAKVERFVLMDQVQYVPRTYMSRNTFLNRSGEQVYLSVPVQKAGYREKELKDIMLLNDDWKGKHMAFFSEHYKRFPFFREIMDFIEPFMEKDYSSIYEVDKASILSVCKMLNITTEFIDQSAYQIPAQPHSPDDDEETKRRRRCMDVVRICQAAEATKYITGAGKSLEFVSKEIFAENHIEFAVQQYTCPVYPQSNTTEFVPNITALDFLFNCGIEESRRIFWANVNQAHEFE